jgi:hypothetical protein
VECPLSGEADIARTSQIGRSCRVGPGHFTPSRSQINRIDTGVQHFKERINLKALKLLESFSRLACHCDALVFLFYRSLVTPLPERGRNTLLRYYVFAGG